jgi:predicted DNA-binding ribbon-helix-helix protein
MNVLHYHMPPHSQKPITTTIALDRTVYKKLKHLAVEREMTVRDLIREAVHQLLTKKVRP